MSAYMVTFVTVIDSLNWVTEYLAHVPSIARRHGGEFLAVSKALPNAVQCVEGSVVPPHSIVIFRFPSMAEVKEFLDSAEYAPYREARIAATESNFFAFENDPDAQQFNAA